MSEPPDTAITLRALQGAPMEDDAVREMVIAAARAIAERQGVVVRSLSTDAGSITVTLAAARLVALGFAAELRRVTTRWYTAKYREPTLWGEPDAADDPWRDAGADA